MGKTAAGGTPIVVVSFPGVRGRQRWVAAVPLCDMLAEVRKRIPADAIAELSDQHSTCRRSRRLSSISGQATFGSSIRLL
jgi:hypothetical protein